jgi:hypothetical protein
MRETSGVNMRSLEQVARELVEAHRQLDPKTRKAIYFRRMSERENEVFLLEVSADSPSTGEASPFRFAPAPQHGVEFAMVLILLGMEDWAAMETNRLKLPKGWDPADQVVIYDSQAEGEAVA